MRYNNTNAILPKQTIHIVKDNFYIEALASSTISFNTLSSAWTTFDYSLDEGKTWSAVDSNTYISLNTGEKAFFRAKQTGDSGDGDMTTFLIDGNTKVAGNIMWLYDYENLNANIIYEAAFKDLFENCHITDASELIIPVVYNRSCENMFLATYLEKAPQLPATTLYPDCYRGMFAWKQNETPMSGVYLPALSIPARAYREMFGYSGAINEVTCLATDISAEESTWNWLRYEGSGTFYKNASMNDWPEGSSGIPYGWTVVNV